jgi:hypothetical protein
MMEKERHVPVPDYQLGWLDKVFLLTTEPLKN